MGTALSRLPQRHELALWNSLDKLRSLNSGTGDVSELIPLPAESQQVSV